MSAKTYLELADGDPFDAPDDWDGEMMAPSDWAHAAARGVVKNLMDRRDIKWGFGNIDEDVRKELVETLAEIIRLAHDRPAT